MTFDLGDSFILFAGLWPVTFFFWACLHVVAMFVPAVWAVLRTYVG